MAKKVLIFGAGSIGNHMANACSKLNYRVFVTDISNVALDRMKNKIYPQRYKKWNKKINIIKFNNWEKLNNDFDLIIIGTPPNTHLHLLKKCLKIFDSDKILIEKPLCSFPEKLDLFKNLENNYIFCGYNHSVSPSINYLFKKLIDKKEKIKFIDIQWREGWNGILGAHYWLKNEFSSYLGDYKSGGGGLQEHSHGLHLAVCLINNFFKKKINLVSKSATFNSNSKFKYDNYSRLFFSNKTQSLNLEIDLLSSKPRKEINVFCKEFNFSWIHNYNAKADAVIIFEKNKEKIKLFKKNRSTEFVNEIKHIESIKTKKDYLASRINVKKGIETIKVIKKFFYEK